MLRWDWPQLLDLILSPLQPERYQDDERVAREVGPSERPRRQPSLPLRGCSLPFAQSGWHQRSRKLCLWEMLQLFPTRRSRLLDQRAILTHPPKCLCACILPIATISPAATSPTATVTSGVGIATRPRRRAAPLPSSPRARARPPPRSRSARRLRLPIPAGLHPSEPSQPLPQRAAELHLQHRRHRPSEHVRL